MMTSSSSNSNPPFPRFRMDLVAEPIDDDGKRFVDVMDPDTGSTFRFFEVEYSLACAMDGARDIAGLVRWAKEELGITPSTSELASVVATLGDLGYLDDGKTPADIGGLASGIVAAAPAPAPAASSSQFELGASGNRAPAEAAELPSTADLELGTPGTKRGAAASVLAASNMSSDALGPAGKVSLDLADQMDVGLDDVKEAVRASRIMQAVDVPPELQAAPEPVVAAPEPVVAAPAPIKRDATPVPAKPVAAAPAVVTKQEPEIAAAPVAEAKTPVVLPSTPAGPAAKALVKLPNRASGTTISNSSADDLVPAKGSSAARVVILLVILAAAGVLLWRFVLHGANKVEDAVKPAPQAQVVKPPVTPPPAPPEAKPVPPTGKLESPAVVATDIKATVAGVITSTVADGATVKTNDEIAHFAGADLLTATIKALKLEVDDSVPAEIAKWQKSRDEATAKNDKVGADAQRRRVSSRRTDCRCLGRSELHRKRSGWQQDHRDVPGDPRLGCR